MTSPEFIGFLLVAIILSGRLSHFVMTTYLTTAVDPLLRWRCLAPCVSSHERKGVVIGSRARARSWTPMGRV